MSAGLLDTSVVIALETGRPIAEDRVPDEGYISVITLAELRAGILAAGDAETRARRLATFERYASISALPADERAAEHWARLRVRLHEADRRINVNDLWIAAIALAHDLPVVTQDADFDPLADLGGPDIIHV